MKDSILRVRDPAYVQALRVEAFAERSSRKPIPIAILLGLSLLYASGYYVRLLCGIGAYLLQTHDFSRAIVLPSLMIVAASFAMSCAALICVRRWCVPLIAQACGILVLSLLAMIGLGSLLVAAGVDFRVWIPRHRFDYLSAARSIKGATFMVAFTCLWLTRSHLAAWSRALASLGFAFAVLAAVRIFTLSGSDFAANAAPLNGPNNAIESVESSSRIIGSGDPKISPEPPVASSKRRAIWVVFDETDFGRVFGGENPEKISLPNFQDLSHISVFATNANSPASATLYSVPSLLTGIPISGDGVTVNSDASLSVIGLDSTVTPFIENSTLFGALAQSGRRASALGFFHPYCRLFKLERCDSFAFEGPIGFADAAWINVPTVVTQNFRDVDGWGAITESSLRLLPAYLRRDDALTFVHLNLPHLPAPYADALLHLRPSPDPLVEYDHNLLLADQVLGQIMAIVRQEAARNNLLLIVSTDHWLRNRWYRPRQDESSRRVPFLVWRVGDSDGIVVAKPFSTVHTAAMILEFLNGKIDSQREIAEWLSRQPVFPSYIVPNSY